MNVTRQQTARRAVLVAAAAVAVPAAMPAGAAAHHQCVPSETYATVDQRKLTQPVDTGHRLPIFNSCGPHQVIVSYTEQDGTKDQVLITQGDLTVTRTARQDPPAQRSADAAPSQDARPAQRAKRRCKSARRAKSRAQQRARRRACARRSR